MILGLGPWELVLIAGLIAAIFGFRGVAKGSRDLGRAYGLLRRFRQKYPWISRVPWLSRFFR